MKRKQNNTKLKKYPRDVQYLLDLGYRYAVEMPAFLKALNQYLKEQKISIYPVAMEPDEMATFLDANDTHVYDACHMAHRFDSKLRVQHLYHKRAALATVYFMVANVAGIEATRNFMESVYDQKNLNTAVVTLRAWLHDRGWRLKKEQWLQVTVAEEVAAWITTWNNLQHGELWTLNLCEMNEYPVPCQLRKKEQPKEILNRMKKEQACKPTQKPGSPATPTMRRPPRLHGALQKRRKSKHYLIPGHVLIADAAKRLDCNTSHIYKWIEAGYLSGKKPFAGGLWQVPITEIDNMLAGRLPKDGPPTTPKAAPKKQKDIRNKQLPLSASIKRVTALDETSRVCSLDDINHLCTVVEMMPMFEEDGGRITTSKAGMTMARDIAKKLQDAIIAAKEDDLDDLNLDDDDDEEKFPPAPWEKDS